MKKVLRFILIMTISAFILAGCSQEIKDEIKEGLDSAKNAIEEVIDDYADSLTNIVTEKPTATETPEVTEEALVTEQPEVTEEPAVTEEPEVTEEPVVTEEPEVTDEPEITEEPVITEEPEVTPEYIEYKFRNNKLLTQHYEKHGIEMGFDSKESYEKAASDVINNPAALHKIEAEDGDYVYYLEETNEFVILSTDGYIRTYFLPSGGKKYYDRQ